MPLPERVAGSDLIFELSGLAARSDYRLFLAGGVVFPLGLGLVVGFVNGLIVTRSKVPSFVVTLATNFALSGLALWLTRAMTGSTSVEIQPESWAKRVFPAAATKARPCATASGRGPPPTARSSSKASAARERRSTCSAMW